MGTSNPLLKRFLGAHPELTEAAERVLEAAARVRAARAAALPDVEDPRPSATVDAGVLEAVTGLERILAQRNDPRSVEVAVRRVATEITRLRARSHRFSPTRKSTSPRARQGLFRALRFHQTAWQELSRESRSRGVRRLPWLLELATHIAPGTPMSELVISGYDLPMVPASQRHWGERCSLTGRAWTIDQREGGERHRSLEAGFRTLSPEAWSLVERLSNLLPGLLASSPEGAALLRRVVPELEGDSVRVGGSIRFERLGLLDFPSQAVALNNVLRFYGERPFFGVRSEHDRDRYRWWSYSELRSRALSLSAYLEGRGASAGECLGVLLPSISVEFHLADFAAVFSKLTLVALPTNLSPAVLLRLMETLEIRDLITDAARLFALGTKGGPVTNLRTVLITDTAGSVPVGTAESVTLASVVESVSLGVDWRSNAGIGSAAEILYGDSEGVAEAAAAGIREDDTDELYTILFTSGSTGTPKGTPVTRRRWVEEMCAESDLWPLVGASFLAPWTAAERGSTWRALINGGRIGRVSSGAGLFDDLAALRPTALDAPPVVWNALHSEYRSAISRPELSPQEAALIRRRVRLRLGGRLRFASCGGAPSDARVRETLAEILEIPIHDSYGSTETGNIAVDGRLRPGLDYRLLSVPDLGLVPGDSRTGRGELVVRTERTADHYVGANEAESHYTEDGYFRTGDLVEVTADGQLRHLGRRKQYFKMQCGSFLAPEEVEEALTASDLVGGVFVAPGPLAQGLVAVVVSRREGLERRRLLDEFRRLSRVRGLQSLATPVAVVIETGFEEGGLPWTAKNGLLTPSLKLNRPALTAHYRQAIEKAWQGFSEQRSPLDVDGPGPLEPVDHSQSLRRLVAAVVSREPESIDLLRSFMDQGGDSLRAMDWVLRMEQVFRLRIDDPSSMAEQPLAWVLDRLQSEMERGPGRRRLGVTAKASEPVDVVPSSFAEPSDSEAKTDLPSVGGDLAGVVEQVRRDVDATPIPQSWPAPASGGAVLLTGGTGFLGSHLLAELASNLPANRKIVALVRARDDGAAALRLAATLRHFELQDSSIGTDLDGNCRIVALAGTLSESRLGLPVEAWAALAERVSMIYHVGALVSSEASYRDLRAVNVGGTQQIIDLMTTGRGKALHYVSTRNVATLLALHHRQRATETTPLPLQLEARDIEASLPYAVSKWVGERCLGELVAAAREQGCDLRVSVSRPALLSWSHTTGLANEGDWFTRILRSCLELGAVLGPEPAAALRWVPETDVSARGLDLVPVDYAARAIARVGSLTEESALPQADAWPGGVPTLHLSNSAAAEGGLTTWARLMDMLVAEELQLSRGQGLEYLSPTDWMSRAEVEGAAVAPILNRLRRHWPQYTRASTQWCEVAVGLSCPPIDGASVRRFLERALGRH